MEAEAKIFFRFLKSKGIKVMQETKLNEWTKKSNNGMLKYLYFDSEDMWLDSNINNIIDFWWEKSDFNIDDEVLIQYYNLSSSRWREITSIEKEMLHNKIDFLDRMNLRNKIMYSYYENYKKY